MVGFIFREEEGRGCSDQGEIPGQNSGKNLNSELNYPFPITIENVTTWYRMCYVLVDLDGSAPYYNLALNLLVNDHRRF